ncbi:MAG: hypothetical protein AABW63_03495 [Nanoarchaeota archaeon]
MVNKEDIEFLNQLSSSLEKAISRLEYAYKSQNFGEFDKLKKFILEVQNKIESILE